MQAGRLRYRPALQSYTVTRDAYGAEVKTWSTEPAFWADRVPQGSREFLGAQQRLGEVSELFKCRYRTDVTLTKRLTWDGRIFDIKGFWNPDGRKRELVIACVEHLGGSQA